MSFSRIATLGLVMIGLLVSSALAQATTQPTQYTERLIFFQDNLFFDKNIEEMTQVFDRAAKAGYTHVAITDTKFTRWNEYGPRGYIEKAQRVRQAARDRGLKFIAICADQTSDLLSNDPSLAEGTPVVDAPFVVRDGQLVPVDSDFAIQNITFAPGEQEGSIAGWELIGNARRDAELSTEASGVLLIENPGSAPGGTAGARQVVKVKPYRYYYLSMMIRSEDFDQPRTFDVPLVGNTIRQGLSHRMYGVKPTQDWTKIQTTFNTLDNTEVTITIGSFGGGKGKVWVRDLHIEPAGIVNLVRREALPVKITSADGQTVYEEGKDLERVFDPQANMGKWPGYHEMWPENKPQVKVLPGGRLKEGDTVLLSYCISQMTYSWGVFACPNEPKTMELVKWQIEQIHKHLEPDGYMMAHDEIRHWGQDPSCINSGKTPAQTLADNVRQCYEIITKEDPGKPVYVWSDMFTPFHNAGKTGKPYYLCKGVDPFYGSWEGLDPNVNIILWWGGNPRRKESAEFFARRGHKIILSAGMQDLPSWMEEVHHVGNGIGTMYTTWNKDYSKIEDFAKMLDEWRPGKYQQVVRPSSDLE